MNLPNRFFKFYPNSNYTIENLMTYSIFLNSPANFKDKLDCSHSLKIEKFTADQIKDLYRNSFNDSILDFQLKIIEDTITWEELIHYTLLLCKEDIENKYVEVNNLSLFKKYKSIYKKPIKGIFDQTLKNVIENARKSFVQKKKIACFSENYSNLLMWSNYACDHTGICLEFDTKYEPFNNANKINYTNLKPTLKIDEILDEKKSLLALEKLFCIKSTEYDFEQEWRIIKNNSTISFPKEALKAVYFGMKMNNKDAESLIDIIQSYYIDVKYFRFYIDSKSRPSIVNIKV